MSQSKTAFEILTAARERLSDRANWRRGRLYSEGATCALGAVGVAAGVITQELDRTISGESGAYNALRKADNGLAEALDALADEAGRVTGVSNVSAVYAFNDLASTTHADVLAAFDRAIARVAPKVTEAHVREIVRDELELAEARRILTEARALIAEQSRWTTGFMCDPAGRYCAAGAVGAVVGITGTGIAGRLVNATGPLKRAVDALGDSAKATSPYHILHQTAVDAIVRANDEAAMRQRLAHRGPEHHAVVLGLFDDALARLA